MEYILFGASMLIVMLAQVNIQSKYAKYRKIATKSKKTGAEVARQMLNSNGLSQIKVEMTNGQLSDHYDPRKKLINLSQDVYQGHSIASVAVAAHEVGHAIQDSENYTFMKLRRALVPIVNFASMLGYISILIGFGASLLKLITIGIIAQIVVLSFHIITLPVEFNATGRAKKYLATADGIDSTEISGIKSMLGAAAFTYVASLLTNILQILRLVLASRNRRR